MAFQIAVKNPIITVSTANTNLDGSGTITDLITSGGTYGTMIDTIRIQSTGAVSNGMIRLFIKTGLGSWSLMKEIPVVASTGSSVPIGNVYATTIAANISLENGYKIGVSTQVGETFNVVAFGYDITGFI